MTGHSTCKGWDPKANVGFPRIRHLSAGPKAVAEGFQLVDVSGELRLITQAILQIYIYICVYVSLYTFIYNMSASISISMSLSIYAFGSHAEALVGQSFHIVEERASQRGLKGPHEDKDPSMPWYGYFSELRGSFLWASL